MDDKFKENIDSMAKEIRTQARNIKVDTFLSYLYTSDILNRYLDCSCLTAISAAPALTSCTTSSSTTGA